MNNKFFSFKLRPELQYRIRYEKESLIDKLEPWIFLVWFAGALTMIIACIVSIIKK